MVALNVKGRTSIKNSLPAEGLEPTRPWGDCHAERSRGISGYLCRRTGEITGLNVERSALNVQ
jgi:hypothetical protein